MPNVIITPHNAFNTNEALMRILETTVKNIRGYKSGRKINLEESVKTHLRGEKYLIGIFMNPFSVHVNRAPIAGTVKKIHHYQHKNHLNLKMLLYLHWQFLILY